VTGTGGLPGAPAAVAPDPRAPHSDWLTYAVSQGMDPADARARTRDQIRACFRETAGSIGAVPDLERHERDPDARAARHEARRPDWSA